MTHTDMFLDNTLGRKDIDKQGKDYSRVQTVLTMFGDGMCLKESLDKAELTFNQFVAILRQFPEMNITFKQQQALHDVAFKHKLVGAIDAQKYTDWKAAAWLLERMYPEEFGKKIEITTGDIDKHPEEAKAIIAKYTKIEEVKV